MGDSTSLTTIQCQSSSELYQPYQKASAPKRVAPRRGKIRSVITAPNISSQISTITGEPVQSLSITPDAQRDSALFAKPSTSKGNKCSNCRLPGHRLPHCPHPLTDASQERAAAAKRKRTQYG
jgi:hypothetical protein